MLSTKFLIHFSYVLDKRPIPYISGQCNSISYPNFANKFDKYISYFYKVKSTSIFSKVAILPVTFNKTFQNYSE